MNTLELRGVEVSPGAPTISASYSGQKIALIGDWLWLRACLAGVRQLSLGEIRCLDQDARRATIEGRVGISTAGLWPPHEDSVAVWIQVNLQLLGEGRKAAKARVHTLLSGLGLASLAERGLSSLNAAEAFAAHAAFAASTQPELIVLGAPLLVPETRLFEMDLLLRLASRHRVAVACEASQLELLQFADEIAVLQAVESRPGLAPTAGNRYRVVPMRGGGLLARELSERGVGVQVAGSRGALMVTLPDGASSDLIVAAALAAEEPLAELVSVS